MKAFYYQRVVHFFMKRKKIVKAKYEIGVLFADIHECQVSIDFVGKSMEK